MGRYASAIAIYNKAIASPVPKLPKLEAELQRGLSSAQFAQQAVAHPITFVKQPLPVVINRFPLIFNPCATADDKTIVFTARKGPNSYQDEDIYIALRDSAGQWQAPKSISDKINSAGNEGTTGLSADGRTLVFTSCERDRKRHCNVYISHKTGAAWSEPADVDSANSDAWDSHPNLSADGRTLVYVSGRAGGHGGYDIYFSQKRPDGKFGPGINAGPNINTADNEEMPFLHANGQTLFFSSAGWPGMGGQDLFMAELLPPIKGQPVDSAWVHWGTPRNLGFPLNTARDESSMFVSPDGSKAYFCIEDRHLGVTRQSLIYEFAMGGALQLPKRAYLAEGTVTDAATKKPLAGHLILTDNATGRPLYEVDADPISGNYTMVLPEGANYGMAVAAPGHLFQSRYFDFADAAKTGSIRLDFALDALKAGAKTVLNNVFFATAKADLLPESQTELARMASLLAANAKLRVEIGGYTDNVGSPAANLALAQRRAQAVVQFLTSRGIAAARLTALGYGEANPAADNATEAGRAKNRRIEFGVK